MSHNCAFTRAKKQLTLYQKIRNKYLELITISQKNRCHFNFFKSNKAVKEEQKRHRRINKYAIHPYSPFRGAYEVFLVVLYTNILFSKPMAAFYDKDYLTVVALLKEFTIVMNLLCWVDIIVTFFSGFVTESQHMYTIELRFRTIARNYMLSPYFICDVLSSLPVAILYYPRIVAVTNEYEELYIAVNLFMMLKLVRVVPLFTYINNSAYYLGFVSKSVPFFTRVALMTILTVHWATCLQYLVPRIAEYYRPSMKNRTWIYRDGIDKKNIFLRYNHAFFKTSAYILAIRQDHHIVEIEEEYFLGLLTYFVGKILVAVVWLLLAMAILKSRSVHIKYNELMNELREYMKRKKLPPNVSDRLSQYYEYKYQQKYFREDLLQSFLPENIKKEVRLRTCKTMIKNVSILSELSHEELSGMIDYLIPEIFLPKDTIVQHGTIGDAMYILFSGTVAVYSRSGKEICHLQDGAYFGEISLILPDQIRNTSVVALEISHVYRLNKREFDRFLVKNKRLMIRIMKEAEERLQQATKIEEEYKQHLFEQKFRFSIVAQAES